MKSVEALAKNGVRLVPDQLIISGGQQGGASNLENMLGLQLLNTLSKNADEDITVDAK